jgi:hypothetical protein
MLFQELFTERRERIGKEFDQLFEQAVNNQTHSGDLLLIELNGSYEREAKEWDNIEDKNPYMYGPRTEGWSDLSHYEFINAYRSFVHKDSHADYVKRHEWSEEKNNEIRQLEKNESLSIQLEMLVYLKIWEADLFIKRLYQIVRLKQGLHYDWHFRIMESNRDKTEDEVDKPIGTRDEIIRKMIRNPLEKEYPEIFKAIKNAFNSQLRNSIAHSKYSLASRYIHLNNSIKKDPYAQTQVISFDDWISKIHDTLTIYDQLINFMNKVQAYYINRVKGNSNLAQEIRINRLDPEPVTRYGIVRYRKEFNDWIK